MTTWNIDRSHSIVEFGVKHMMFSTVKGRFGAFEGSVTGDLNDLTAASFGVTVDVASIDTRDEQRDGHLRSADFFDVENYPKLTFKSKRVEKTGSDSFKLIGDLSVRGVTKEVTFDATFEGEGKDPWGNQRFGLSAQTSINRKDYGLNWNAALEAGGFLVGDTVKISVEAQAIKQA